MKNVQWWTAPEQSLKEHTKNIVSHLRIFGQNTMWKFIRTIQFKDRLKTINIRPAERQNDRHNVKISLNALLVSKINKVLSRS